MVRKVKTQLNNFAKDFSGMQSSIENLVLENKELKFRNDKLSEKIEKLNKIICDQESEIKELKKKKNKDFIKKAERTEKKLIDVIEKANKNKEKITVTELSERSNISRQTIYRRYKHLLELI